MRYAADIKCNPVANPLWIHPPLALIHREYILKITIIPRCAIDIHQSREKIFIEQCTGRIFTYLVGFFSANTMALY